MKKLYGVTTAMTTPFDENDCVDFEALACQTRMLVDKGVQCLYPGGTTGEMLRMTVDERKKLAETVLDAADGRVTVYIHCGAMQQKNTIELVRHSWQIGADGAGVVTPQFFGLNPREMEEYYVAVSRSVPDSFPIYLYNIPQCAANDISAETAEKIAARCPNIIGIKYSFADINRTFDYLKINNWNFSVMHGCDRVFLAMLSLGCDGTVSGISGVFPEPFVAVYDAFLRKDYEAALRHQRQAARITDILKSGSNMSYFKEALKMRGIPGGHMRRPQLDLPEEEIRNLRSELEAFCRDTGIPLQV